MESIIESPRLRLIRLHDTDINSEHVKWFHELWSDTEFTAWSLHGKCHNLQESQEWLTTQLTKFNGINYVIFEKNDANGIELPKPGNLIGSIGLRLQEDGPLLPPFSPPQTSAATNPAPKAESKALNLRVLGYGFLEPSWGKGYATEAGRVFIDAYAASVAEQKAKGKENFYIEAQWDNDNPASQKVLAKLGFSEVGWLVEEKKVFLAGKWRDPGQWICGLYV